MSLDRLRSSPLSNDELDRLDAEEAARLLSSDVPGTLPGLAGSIRDVRALDAGAYPTGPARDFADVADADDALRRSEAEATARSERARRAVPNASLRRSVMEKTGIPLPFVDSEFEYNPFALGLAVPGAPTALAAIDEAGELLGMTPDRPFSEREAEWQGMQDVAEMESPGSAAFGRLAGLGVSAPLLIGSAPAAMARASLPEALAILGRSARVPAAVGTVGGLASGTLRSEGQEGLDRAGTIVGSGLRGGATAGTVATLANVGGALRLLGATRSGIPGAAMTFAGGATEGAGFGAMGRASETRRNLSDPEYMGEVLTPNAADIGIGGAGALGLRWITSQAPRSRSTRAFDPRAEAERDVAAEMGVDDLPDAAPVDLPEYQRPARDGSFLTDSVGANPLADMASEARLGAGGVSTVRQRRQAIGSFSDMQDAAEAMRESGISPRQSLRGVPGNVRHAEAVRDRASAQLSGLYDLAQSRGAVVPGNVISDDIESFLRSRSTQSAGTDVRSALSRLGQRADELRYGVETPERAAYESALERYGDMPVDDIGETLLTGDMPGPEITGLTPRMMARSEVAPRLMPMRESVRNLSLLRSISGERGVPNVGSPSLPTALQRVERAALTRGRNEALNRSIPDRMGEYQDASRDFRIANIVSPYDAPAAASTAAAANLSAELQLAANGIPAFLGRHAIAPHLSAIRATIAEGGFRGLGESVADAAQLGTRYADRLGISPRTAEMLRSVGLGSGRGASMAEQRGALRAVADALPLGRERSAFAAASNRAGRGMAAEAAPALMAANSAASRNAVDPSLVSQRDAAESDARRALESADYDNAAQAADDELRSMYGLAVPDGEVREPTQDDIDADEANRAAMEELRALYATPTRQERPSR